MSDTQHGVFVFQGELKTVVVGSDAVQRDLDQMIDDLPNYFVGLFDRDGDYQQFLSDVALTANKLATTTRFDNDGESEGSGREIHADAG